MNFKIKLQNGKTATIAVHGLTLDEIYENSEALVAGIKHNIEMDEFLYKEKVKKAKENDLIKEFLQNNPEADFDLLKQFIIDNTPIEVRSESVDQDQGPKYDVVYFEVIDSMTGQIDRFKKKDLSISIFNKGVIYQTDNNYNPIIFHPHIDPELQVGVCYDSYCRYMMIAGLNIQAIQAVHKYSLKK